MRRYSFQGQVSGLYISSHKSWSQFWRRGEKGRRQRGKLRPTAKNRRKVWLVLGTCSICCWNAFLPIWPLVLSMSCFILRYDIDGFVEAVNDLFPLVSISFSVCWLSCATLHSFIYYGQYILTFFVPVFHPVYTVVHDLTLVCLCLLSLSRRTKRSSVLTTECIFELPQFTVQATRAQTLLLQAICQSWTHSMVNGAPMTLSESLLNEVYKAAGKQQALL